VCRDQALRPEQLDQPRETLLAELRVRELTDVGTDVVFASAIR
jgi:hypothetical protein